MWQLPPFFPRKEMGERKTFRRVPNWHRSKLLLASYYLFLSFLTERCGNPAPPSGSSPPVPHSIQSAPNEDGDIQTERRRKIKHNQPFPSKKTDTKQNRKKGFESPYKSPCHLVFGKAFGDYFISIELFPFSILWETIRVVEASKNL